MDRTETYAESRSRFFLERNLECGRIQVLGWCRLASPEARRMVPAFTVGYWIRPSAQGFGYVTEAVGLVVNFALDALGAQRLEIACDPNNLRSMAIPRRLGFKMEGRARNVYRYPDGRLCDEVIWSLTPTDSRPVANQRSS